jgi:protein-L-isoaspartate(D-aspartate) O-methyltransferase
MSDLPALRRFYAEELRAVSDIRSEALVRAFAAVPREHYLGPGPWQILAPTEAGRGRYRTTEDDDPRHLYHNVLVAIDAARWLNNGQPGALALWIDALDLRDGERVVHIGCGLGYYSAILAEVVGAAGHVTALEIDPALAARARRNLAHLPHVEVREADGASCDLEPVDAIFVNAGAAHVSTVWLDALRVNGRLLVPLTVARDAAGHGNGGMLKVTRRGDGWPARFVSEVNIFPCIGARDAALNERLKEAFQTRKWHAVTSLRRDHHDPTETCWLHGGDVCLSTAPGE